MACGWRLETGETLYATLKHVGSPELCSQDFRRKQLPDAWKLTFSIKTSREHAWRRKGFDTFHSHNRLYVCMSKTFSAHIYISTRKTNLNFIFHENQIKNISSMTSFQERCIVYLKLKDLQQLVFQKKFSMLL